MWLLIAGDPQTGEPNDADTLTDQFTGSRTLFSRVPTDLYATRAAIAKELAAPPPPSARKTARPSVVGAGQPLTYTLAYRASDVAHTVVFGDDVPTATTVLTATGSKAPAPSVAGQTVGWTVAVGAGEAVTLTITAQAASMGTVTNTATFSGTLMLEDDARVLVCYTRVFLPLVLREL